MAKLSFGDLKTRIEVPVFCVVFSIFGQASVFTNLIIYRTCYINLGHNISDCALLGTGNESNFIKQLEQAVEPDGNTISLFLTLPTGVICAFMALFIGSWSDRNGRKPVLIITMGGQALSFALVAVYCFFPNLSPWYLYITVIPVLMTGGFAAMITSFLSYITDVCDERSRGMRLGIFEVIFSSGTLIAIFSSSYIFKMVDYVGVYLVSTGFLILGICFTVFFLEESLSVGHIESHSQQLQPPFVEQLRAMTRCVFRKRPLYERSLILLCILITALFICAIMSENGIIYLFLRLKFGWSLRKFTLFSSLRELLVIVGTFLGVYGLHKKLEVNETVVVLMGLISSFSSSLVQGLATVDFHIYFAGALRLLAGCVNPMLRFLISKVAKADEVGKIFSVTLMSQSILQLVGGPLYTEIYNRSLSTWPSLYNFITAGIYFVSSLLAIAVMILVYKTGDRKFKVLEEDIDVPTESSNADEPELIRT